MIRFNKNFTQVAYRFGGSADPSLPRVKDAPTPDLRDKLHAGDLTEYEKSFLSEHSTMRRPFTLYNFLSKLPYFLFDSVTLSHVQSADWPQITKLYWHQIACTCPDSLPTESQSMIRLKLVKTFFISKT